MRKKISNRHTDHNIRGAVLAIILLAGLSLAAAGCGSKDNPESAANNSASSTATKECRVTVNTKPWESFQSLAARLSVGQPVGPEELEAYATLPSVAKWRRSLTPHAPTVTSLVNWVHGAWAEQLGTGKKFKATTDRTSISRGFRYCQQHSADIDVLLAEFTSGEASCELRALTDMWIRPEVVPSPLVLNFLPAMTEIRIFEKEIFVDTGVLQAGGSAQSVRHIASLLYRNLEALEGENPVEVGGQQAVAEVFRVMMNEGLASWIEETLRLEFDPGHRALRKVNIIPEDFFRKAQQTVDTLELLLPGMLTDPVIMEKNGLQFARQMASSSAFTSTGLAMATVIGHRLGTERLQQVRRSVPDFLAAYQEAARLNTLPIPEPGTAGIELYESVQPFSPEVYEGLHAMLTEYYAAP